MDDKIAVSVNHVSKDFVLPIEHINTLKGLFTNISRLHSIKASKVQHALKDISFEVKKGEFFGVVGRNGSGKSTLLKIIAGIYQPNGGQIKVNGRLVPFIELGVGFNGELTGRENVYLNGALLGFTRQEMTKQYKDIVDFAGIEPFMDQKLKNYSSGMQVRLAFSLAIRANADVLLVDEVLAVGDADFQRKCFDYFRKLKKTKKTVILVTHDMNAIREYCDRAIMIEKNVMIAQGSPAKVASRYSRLFIDSPDAKNTKGNNDNRWGDKSITFDSVEVLPKKIMPSDETLTIKMTATAHKAVERPIFGFLIKNAAHVQIFGNNSQIKKQIIEKMHIGQKISIEWKIPNIFNDGNYFVDPAAVYKGGTQTADWWEEAVEFTILKEDKTPYITNPDMDFKYVLND